MGEIVKAINDRLSHLDGICATAERRGPSHKGYVTDATFHHWCGERDGLRQALRIIEKEPS
jgi:hypothetical protein